mmetsp:Transcript_85610/g.247098  ORF Transcript_85610/g.247098 Transcript_85610/m.247098 type:complete len:159 (-) Transcript_85610:175-651(-)
MCEKGCRALLFAADCFRAVGHFAFKLLDIVGARRGDRQLRSSVALEFAAGVIVMLCLVQPVFALVNDDGLPMHMAVSAALLIAIFAAEYARRRCTSGGRADATQVPTNMLGRVANKVSQGASDGAVGEKHRHADNGREDLEKANDVADEGSSHEEVAI